MGVIYTKLYHLCHIYQGLLFVSSIPSCIIVQLGLGLKLNTKIGLHTTYLPTHHHHHHHHHHTNFLKGSRPSRRLGFGMLTLLTKIRSSAEEKNVCQTPPPKKKFAKKKILPKKKFCREKKFSPKKIYAEKKNL